MKKQQTTPVRQHYYNPIFMELRGAEHLFGIPRLCGYEWNNADTRFRIDGSLRRGARERALFKYTISGCGELELNGSAPHVLHAGDAFLLAGAVDDVDYSYRIAPGADHWEFLFLSFDKPYAVNIVRRIIGDCGNVVQLDASGAAVSGAWRLFETFKSGEIHDRYAVSATGYEFLMHLCSESLTFCGKNHGNDLLHRVAAYCFRRLAHPITVEELAELCGFSRWHFAKVFRDAAGMSPSEFILEQKLSTALQILQHGEPVAIKELAFRCGFADPGYFGRRFKKRYGVSPAHFDEIELKQGRKDIIE